MIGGKQRETKQNETERKNKMPFISFEKLAEAEKGISKMGNFFGEIYKIAKPQIKFGKPTKRKICGCGEYYWKGMPQLTDELKEQLHEIIGTDDYKSCMIQIYNGGDTIGWHTDKRPKGYTSDMVEMWSWGFLQMIHFGSVECDDTYPIGYFETRDAGVDWLSKKTEIISGSKISCKAYDIEHRAKTYKSKGKFINWDVGAEHIRGCDFRLNITIRK